MLQETIRGTVWKCGDDVTAYEIIAKNRWTLNRIDPEELGKWALEGAEPSVKDVPWGFKNKGFDVVIAGRDFGGGGKSIEHPVVALKGASVKLVVAESFSRYNFRNSINLGLPVMNCRGITRVFNTGDGIEANLLTGEIRNTTTNEVIIGTPLTDFILELIEAGGLLEYNRKQLKKSV